MMARSLPRAACVVTCLLVVILASGFEVFVHWIRTRTTGLTILGRFVVDSVVRYQNITRCDFFEPRNHPQDSRFATTRGCRNNK